MLDRNLVTQKMKERGFTVYAYMGNIEIHFVSERMFDVTYEERVPPRERIPIINVIVDLEKEEFQCIYL